MPSRKSAGIPDSNRFPFCVLNVGFQVIQVFVLVQTDHFHFGFLCFRVLVSTIHRCVFAFLSDHEL